MGNLNTAFTVRQLTNNNREDLNNTINKIKSIHTLQSATGNCKMYILSSSHGTFSNIDHILGQKPNFNKYKRTKIIQNMYIEYSGIMLKF